MNSMTGFGSARMSIHDREITAEIKSVNNKFLEISVRTPRSYTFAEDKIKSYIQSSLSRGKIDVNINITSQSTSDIKISLNDGIITSYINALRSEKRLNDDLSLSDLLRIPDAIVTEKSETDTDEVTADILETVAQALTGLSEMRQKEGQRLKNDIAARLNLIEDYVLSVEKISPDTTAKYREKLFKKLSEILADKNIDESRVLTEAAIFAEKTAVAEETVRLKSHINQYRTFLEAGEPIGRKADFLTQEMNREANTIGSKCQDIEVTKIVLDIKSEIEKIREQIQNVE
ncbi:MAG: YicC family protein [Ruminococcus sp.]|nr:YicC family protein [Ruminococcus sp.]